MYQTFERGGLRVIGIERKLRAYQIRHVFSFLSGNYCKWHSFTEYWIGLSLRQFKLWRNDIPHSSEIPVFYERCLRLIKSVFPELQIANRQVPTLKTIYWTIFGRVEK